MARNECELSRCRVSFAHYCPLEAVSWYVVHGMSDVGFLCESRRPRDEAEQCNRPRGTGRAVGT